MLLALSAVVSGFHQGSFVILEQLETRLDSPSRLLRSWPRSPRHEAGWRGLPSLTRRLKTLHLRHIWICITRSGVQFESETDLDLRNPDQ